ncbi:GNAT family N-acetyltransferase [Catalinimonas niigatensis]|uniref:GNAT family N-acetyltransferase n=1 Tax=Catalinimonas niigatensis TaxID=1397264 RepID=UPI002665E08D|nr:GNAT family N-acetyltransferase [Catalinimonas niigatensis]WPP49869.1 GNAT family N-acetyltransferase [Catalinimonas niigatensis]
MTNKALIHVSTDADKLDVEFIHHNLNQTRWAKERTLEEVNTAIENSLNFGIYYQGQQVGYARLLTDYMFMAYLLDVFVAEEYRGKGFALHLMQSILKDERLRNIKIWRLGTDDAHGLYERVGFKAIEQPEKLMEIKVKK